MTKKFVRPVLLLPLKLLPLKLLPLVLSLLVAGGVRSQPPIAISHIVVFGNAYSDTGNTRALFDELSGRKKPSRLRQDIRYHGPDMIDAASSFFITAAAGGLAWYMGWDRFLNKLPGGPKTLMAVRSGAMLVLASAIYKTGLGHWLSKPVDLLVDRSELLLSGILWLYPGIGLPVLPPGQLYDRNGRFTNGPRVWPEMLTQQLRLDPDNPDHFLSLGYAGSNILQRLSEEDMLSFSHWLNYVDIGTGLANTLLDRESVSPSQDSFWNRAASHLQPAQREHFEELLRNGVPPSFEYMVNDYGNRNKYSGVRAPDSTLYIITYGSDDYVIDDSDVGHVLDALIEGMATLITRDGARHILVNQLQEPPALSTQRHMAAQRKSQIREQINSHNYQLITEVSNLMRRYPGVTITVLTTEDSLQEQARRQQLSLEPCLRIAAPGEQDSKLFTVEHIPVLGKTTAFTDPITDGGSSLKAASSFIGKPVARCRNPNQHLFYDNYNLTTQGHLLMAQIVCKKLSESGYLCPASTSRSP